MDLVGLGAADLTEQRERFVPARLGGVVTVGVLQSMAQLNQGASLAKAVAGS